MATLTLGTNGTTTLTAMLYSPTMSNADLATLQQLILNDMSQPSGQLAQTAPAAKPVWPGGFSRSGVLYVPNRGFLKALPGDYVGVDANGWPILVSANAIAGGSSPSASTSWSHS